ncbi:hypothetical protein HU200_056010 [Digitaria exilis]|uniref:Uncharacterized protein n=1 Tax=Digitaria exilis TaxID=1010633 RepID=A0A835AHI3_9POAL|nr:hypothetical protein HU200_056010 [Digitaria exilis]
MANGRRWWRRGC